MDKQDFVWFLPSKNIWKDLNVMDMKDTGALIFKDSTYDLKIYSILSISYGKQGRDFVNNWVQIEYQPENEEIQTTFLQMGNDWLEWHLWRHKKTPTRN